MKRLFTILLLLSVALMTNAQIVITEIMYNPPESGSDVNEFIEFYNAGADAVDMDGFYFTEGVKDTIHNFVLQPGAFLLIAKDSVMLNTNFGVSALQWSDGALSNGGEDIVLVNAAGITVDSVDYDDGNGWPESADGDGFSLVLCDYSSDNNDPANWQAASTSTGVTINDKEVFANPGADSECQASALVRFIANGEDVNEDAGTVSVGVEFPAGDFVAWEAMVALNVDASTATNGMDFIFVDTTLAHSGFDLLDTVWLEIPIIDDEVAEETESIILSLTGINIDANAAFNTYTINIADNDSSIPTYTIGEVTTVDENGVVDSMGVVCKIQGIVYGVNMRPSGLQFTIIDGANDGIGLFHGSGDLGYTVQEGDEILVQGTIGQFRGLAQIAPDSIWLISGGNALVDPSVVTALDETTESQLVKIENLSIVDPAEWSNSGSGFNVTVTDGVNNYAMRIDADTDIFGTDAPTESFNLTGIGGQYDTSEPLTEGYQILPRYMQDIDIIEATREPWPNDVDVFPNPTKGQLTIQLGEKIDRLVIRDILGSIVFTRSDVQSNTNASLGDLPAGIYVLSIQRSGKVWTRKVTKM